MALMRLVDVEDAQLVKSAITIDGVDISGISLNVLRSHISLIPQEPIVFQSSLRFNMDPYGVCSDEEIWSVLDIVGLREAYSSMKGNKLDADASGAIIELSFGQKQLLCMARALLRKSRVLICDEATSNLDEQSDLKIREVLNT